VKIILVRHGQSEANITRTIAGHRPTPLSDFGKEQAQELGQMLSESQIKFDAVHSSDLIRASQTTEIMCRVLGISDIIYDKRLREGEAGYFTGKRFDELTDEEQSTFHNLIVDLDSKAHDGESTNEQMERTREAFLEIVNNHPEDSTILLVGHGGTLYHILRNTLNVLPERDEWFGNCKLNVIERQFPESDWKLTILDNIQLEV
jgi:probable phosphoglycerate mutase